MTAVSRPPVLAAAAAGRLPEWAVAGEGRRAHIARVRRLVSRWARDLSLDDAEQARWAAAATLHDALRTARPAVLLDHVPTELQALPTKLWHGPAVAERLRVEGVDDEGLLRAVAFHSVGHPELDAAGRALFAADVLEPGRSYRPGWRARLRARFPDDPDGVVREVAAFRIERVVDVGLRLRDETVGFWNTLVDETKVSGEES
jgi:HD superfamily phosphohydrolase YqeK